MRILTGLVCVLSIQLSVAQKELSNTFDATGIEELIIDSDAIFKIKLTTTTRPQIKIRTGIEGETFESALLLSEQKNKQLILTTGRSPEYIHYDDKLAAHKVMSVELTIEVPEELAITIVSELASVRAEGHYGLLNWSLRDGDVRLFRFRGSGMIKTVTGLVLVESAESQIAAQSRNGHVAGRIVTPEFADLQIQSIDGDILVTQSP
ncbi:hypothetical protein [Croceiramulus getboli]|nr:hypothetical protein P8624_05430 [Flavobacteriaceae bacterium YJPT1-3]